MVARHIREQYSLVCLPCLQVLDPVPGTRPRQDAWVRRGGREGPTQGSRRDRGQPPLGARCWTFRIWGNLPRCCPFVGTAGEPLQGKSVKGGQAARWARIWIPVFQKRKPPQAGHWLCACVCILPVRCFINEFTDLLHAVLRLQGWGCAPSCRLLWGGWGRTGSHLAGEINRPVWTGLQLCGSGLMTRTYRGVMRG